LLSTLCYLLSVLRYLLIDICSSIHLYVFSIPSLRGIFGDHPNFSFISLLSEFLPRTPHGPGICFRFIFLPAISAAIIANWLIVTISSDPILTGPVKSEFISLLTPSIHSSMYRKDLVCSPSPHISISPPSAHSATFLH